MHFVTQGGEKEGYLGGELEFAWICSGGACIHALGALCYA
jgi:hypothetical protein